MAKLKIEYEPKDRLALLSAEGDELFWNNVVRACSDHSDQVVTKGASALSIPWWEFLACREAIGYHVAKNNIELEFDSAAEVFLERAEKIALAFDEKSGRPNTPIQEIQACLGTRGFSRELTTEQKRNVSKLSGLPAGATFSVPGAGKTAEALALFFLNSKENTRLLVIAPKNAFAAWEREL